MAINILAEVIKRPDCATSIVRRAADRTPSTVTDEFHQRSALRYRMQPQARTMEVGPLRSSYQFFGRHYHEARAKVMARASLRGKARERLAGLHRAHALESGG